MTSDITFDAWDYLKRHCVASRAHHEAMRALRSARRKRLYAQKADRDSVELFRAEQAAADLAHGTYNAYKPFCLDLARLEKDWPLIVDSKHMFGRPG